MASELMKKQMYKKWGMGYNGILEEIFKVFILFWKGEFAYNCKKGSEEILCIVFYKENWR